MHTVLSSDKRIQSCVKIPYTILVSSFWFQLKSGLKFAPAKQIHGFVPHFIVMPRAFMYQQVVEYFIVIFYNNETTSLTAIKLFEVIESFFTMNISAASEQEFGDAYFDKTKNEKRLVRVSVKTYDSTGSYITIKLLNNIDGNFKFNQRLTLTVSEFEKLTSQANVVKSLLPVVNKERTKLKRTWRPRTKTHCDNSASEKEHWSWFRQCMDVHQNSLYAFRKSSSFL